MDCNQTIISGRIVKSGILRYTPAGTAVIEFTICHSSKQVEAEIPRKVFLELLVVVLGQLALTVSEFKVGASVKLKGFLNKKNHANPQLVLHAKSVILI